MVVLSINNCPDWSAVLPWGTVREGRGIPRWNCRGEEREGGRERGKGEGVKERGERGGREGKGEKERGGRGKERGRGKVRGRGKGKGRRREGGELKG